MNIAYKVVANNNGKLYSPIVGRSWNDAKRKVTPIEYKIGEPNLRGRNGPFTVLNDPVNIAYVPYCAVDHDNYEQLEIWRVRYEPSRCRSVWIQGEGRKTICREPKVSLWDNVILADSMTFEELELVLPTFPNAPAVPGESLRPYYSLCESLVINWWYTYRRTRKIERGETGSC